MRFLKFLSILIISQVLFSCGVQDHQKASSPLPNVKAEYETAEFWIARLSEPQKLILTSEEIEKRNQAAIENQSSGLVDIFSFPEKLDSTYMTVEFSKVREASKNYKRFDHGNNPVPQKFYEDLFATFETQKFPDEIIPLYGLITTPTNLREFPTDEISMEGPNDTEFDYFQYSRLELGLPVAILHATQDKSWYFVQSPFANGWVKAQHVGMGVKEDVRKFAKSPPLVVTGKEVPVYGDKEFFIYANTLHMGGQLPLEGQVTDFYQVTLPYRNPEGQLVIVPGYIKVTADVNIGYLHYTSEAVLRQAFKMLNTPYGWGGMFDGADCSQFLMGIFQTFGFNFPRNSADQANFMTGKITPDSKLRAHEQFKLLQKYENVPTILYLRGHIMLNLGVIEGRAYAIHSTWAYRKNIWFKDRIFYIGKNVVSDLSLGENSKRGSLIDRILDIVPIA